VLTLGSIWWVVWVMCGGFSDSIARVCATRAICGIGGALMVPSIIALIGINIPPGHKRNIGFAFFGAMSPVGAAGGSLVGAVIVQLAHFKWIFLLL
jgi:MFS family permease